MLTTYGLADRAPLVTPAVGRRSASLLRDVCCVFRSLSPLLLFDVGTS